MLVMMFTAPASARMPALNCSGSIGLESTAEFYRRMLDCLDGA